jgi:tetratricopeptide (TPR) repeat protein
MRGVSIEKTPWGSGEELHFQVTHPRNQKQWLFYNDDDILIGAVFKFPDGIDLKPYSVLRDTLSQLPISMEFYGDATNLLRGSEPATVRLYRTGDQTTTTQYIVRDKPGDDYVDLLVTVVVIDPYEPLLLGTQPKFLPLSPASAGAESNKAGSQNQLKQDTFLANQQFARGESAHFGSCPGQENQTDIAIDAYRRAIQIGIKNPSRLAEAHHRLGLDLRNNGQLPEAKLEIEKSLKIRPLAPNVLNSLGTVLIQLDKPSEAIVPLEKAVILKPNYALARYNLAGAYETVNRQRAIEQYETYLALVEGIPEESTRAALAQDRLNKLKQ